MCRIVNVPGSSSDEMYFEMGGMLFCYSMRHFTIITRLKCDRDVKYKYIVIREKSQFAKSYYKQTA